MKLTAKELRIGNLLQDNEGNIVEVIRLWQSGMIEVHSHIHQFHDFMQDENDLFESIPLTEEILLKIEGIEKLYNSEWEYLLKISAAKLYFRFNGGHCYTQFNETYLGNIIQYLHELQNFCHVYKKELEIKL